MMNKYSAATLLALGSLAAQAQDAARIQTKVVGDDNQPVLVQFNAAGKAAYRGVDAAQVLRQHLALAPADELRATTAETDQLGFTHQKFAQYYQGVRVEHAAYTAHLRAGTVEGISGDFERLAGLNTAPALSAAAALKYALAHVGAQTYMWQDAGEEAALKHDAHNPAATYYPQGELVIVRRQATAGEALGLPVLAWKFNVYAQEPVSRAYLYVDARTGQVVLQDDIIKHAGATGSFATAYSGTRSFADGTTTGGFFLREGTTRGLGIETYNLKRLTQYNKAVDFVDADNNWTAAEYNNVNFDNVAGDAHIGAQLTYDYWKAVHNRNSYDNLGAKIKSYVHYGRSYENAYWNGSVMTYGDGATRFRPLTSLDVCGHEIGHAVCEKTANLTYSNESGALNEGLSDIWGASIEDYAVATLGVASGGVKAKSTWLIGEEIDKQQAALRSMSDPKSLGQPDYYQGVNWYVGTNDNGGVHRNSGVVNYWYYLISAGKTGVNEKGVAYTVASLGLTAAAKITFRMESVYMTAGTTYAQARTYAIQAATDLDPTGANGYVAAVTNAWNAVGVTGAAARTTTTAGSSAPAGAPASLTGRADAARTLSVYPVPAAHELHLALDGNAAIVSVRVSDLRGAAIGMAHYDGRGTLDVSGLAKGMYLLSVSDGKATFRQRFVKE